MEKIWNHTFHNELKVNPEEHPVIMNEEMGNSRSNREKTTQIMFETFNIPAFHLAQSSVLELYASGKITGTILSVGHTKSDVACIYQGNLLPKGEISHLGGRELNKHLQTMLNKSGYNFVTNTDLEIVNEIKENICYVKNSKDLGDLDFKLPDGQKIILGKERYLTTELLFDTSKVGAELSLQEIVSNCIKSQSNQINAEELFKNVIVTGGGSMFEGIAERLETELKNYSEKAKVLAPPERRFCHWIGESVLCSLNSFQSKWVTKKQYDENGLDIINTVCSSSVSANHQIRHSK
jgi:actin, other eukaryote